MRGLVLEGGGARGCYQIGAYKALVEMGIDFALFFNWFYSARVRREK